MTATLLGWIGTGPMASAALRYRATALTILLFLLSIRRAEERAGRAAERLKTTKKTNEVHRRMLEARLVVLMVATNWLVGYVTSRFEGSTPETCPPVVQ